MKIFKVVGMNTDKFDSVLGISVLSKKAFDKLQKENKEVVGFVALKEKTDKKGNVIDSGKEVIGHLEVAGMNTKVYEGNPSSFLYYVETNTDEFLKVVKSL